MAYRSPLRQRVQFFTSRNPALVGVVDLAEVSQLSSHRFVSDANMLMEEELGTAKWEDDPVWLLAISLLGRRSWRRSRSRIGFNS